MKTYLDQMSRRLSAAVSSAPTQTAQLSLWLGLLLSALASLLSRNPAWQPWPVLILWSAGLILFVAGAGSRQLPQNGRHEEPAHPITRWELLALVLLSAAALALRAYSVASIPHNVHGDEGEMGMVARAVLSGALRDPFSTSWADHPSLWFFIQALALRVFGNDIGGLRLLSAVMGASTVPVLFFFARPLYGGRVALVAALLLTVYHFHVQFSRLGLNNIGDPLLVLLTLLFLFRGFRTGNRRDFALAGVIAGVAQYFYFGTRLIPVLVLIVLVYLFLWNRSQLKQRGAHLGLMLVGFLAAIAPSVVYYAARPETFTGKFSSRFLIQGGGVDQLASPGQSPLAALSTHAYQTMFYYFATREQGQFYGSGIPMLDHGMDILFLVGALIALLSWKKPAYAALLIWVFGVAFFGGFLQWQPQESQRYLMATPALCILMAIALSAFGRLLVQGGGFHPMLSRVTVGVLLLAIVAWNVGFYFWIYTPRNDYANAQAVTDLADYLAPRARGSYVYLFTAPQFFLNHGTIRFVARDPVGADVTQALGSIADLPPIEGDLAPVFVFTPDRIGELNLVKQKYPGGSLTELRGNPAADQVLLYVYEPAH